MTDKTDSQSYSRLAIARIFSFVGWVSFWTQLLLGVVATGIFLGFKIQRSGNQIGNPGSGFGVFFAALGLLSLAGGVVVAFRYTRIGKKLASSNYSNHPRRIETLNVIRMGFMVNLIGMLLTLFGAQAISGSLLLKAVSYTHLTLPTTPYV